MAIFKILNADKTVAVASVELADLAAEHTYISESEDQIFIFDEDQDGTGKDIFEAYGAGEYKVLQWVSAS